MTTKPFSVLLVDDDPHTCNIFRMVMDHHQLQLNIHNNAEAAIEFLKTNQPDVIVLDIFLPGTDGYQTLNLIRRNALAPQSRIVATTAYYTIDTKQDVMSRGFNGFLPKPLDSSNIVTYLETLISGN